MSYCDDCLHKEVCGVEGRYDEAMNFCADKLPGVTPADSVIEDIKSEIKSNGIKFDSYDYDMIAVLDVLDIIDCHIGERSEDAKDSD